MPRSSTPPMTTPNETHFYAMTGLGWAVAATRVEAITKVVKEFGTKGKSLYVWSCRVDAPITATYPIKGFVPADVETDLPQHGDYLAVGKVIYRVTEITDETEDNA